MASGASFSFFFFFPFPFSTRVSSTASSTRDVYPDEGSTSGALMQSSTRGETPTVAVKPGFSTGVASSASRWGSEGTSLGSQKYQLQFRGRFQLPLRDMCIGTCDTFSKPIASFTGVAGSSATVSQPEAVTSFTCFSFSLPFEGETGQIDCETSCSCLKPLSLWSCSGDWFFSP